MQKTTKDNFNAAYSKIMRGTVLEKEDIASLIMHWFIIGCWHSFDATRSSCECFNRIVNFVYNKTINIMQSDTGRAVLPDKFASPETKNAVSDCVHSVCLNICSRAKDDRSVLCKNPFEQMNSTSKHILEHGAFVRLSLYRLIVEQACVACDQTVSLFANRTYFTNKCLKSNMTNFYVNQHRVKFSPLSKVGIRETLFNCDTQSLKTTICDIVEGIIYSDYNLRCVSHQRHINGCITCMGLLAHDLADEVYKILVQCGNSWHHNRDQQEFFLTHTLCKSCLKTSSAHATEHKKCVEQSKYYLSNLGSAVVFITDVVLCNLELYPFSLVEMGSRDNMKDNLDGWYLPCLSTKKGKELKVRYPSISYSKSKDKSEQRTFDHSAWERRFSTAFSKEYTYTKRVKSLHFYSGTIKKDCDNGV